MTRRPDVKAWVAPDLSDITYHTRSMLAHGKLVVVVRNTNLTKAKGLTEVGRLLAAQVRQIPGVVAIIFDDYMMKVIKSTTFEWSGDGMIDLIESYLRGLSTLSPARELYTGTDAEVINALETSWIASEAGAPTDSGLDFLIVYYQQTDPEAADDSGDVDAEHFGSRGNRAITCRAGQRATVLAPFLGS